MIDTDNSGTITFEELKVGLKRVGSELMESEIKALMDAVSYLLETADTKIFLLSCIMPNNLSIIFYITIS